MTVYRTVLALDLGTKTGWAIARGERVLVSGTESFVPNRFEGAGMRLLRFGKWLREVVDSDVSEVVYEEIRRHAGVTAAHIYGGLMGQLQVVCEELQVPYCGVPVATIKKFASGKGNASKDDVIAGVRRYGYAPRDDNEADAIALALSWLRVQGHTLTIVPPLQVVA